MIMHTTGATDIGPVPAGVPAFLAKLWRIVEDPEIDDLICWNDTGMSFYIRNQARFSRELLPLYYKHNNMASFIRQLNMYGFHKISSVEQGGLRLDKDEMEFAHKFFVRGHEYLLENIKRKLAASVKGSVEEAEKIARPEVVTRVLSEVRNLKGKQDAVDSHLSAMKRENEALWREVASLRQKHFKQQQIVNKLIQFLVTLVQRNKVPAKRRYPLAIGESPQHVRSDESGSKHRRISDDGPIIHDITNDLSVVVDDSLIFEQEVNPAKSPSIGQPSTPLSSEGARTPGTPVFSADSSVLDESHTFDPADHSSYPLTIGFQIGDEPIQILTDGSDPSPTLGPDNPASPAESLLAVNPASLVKPGDPDEESTFLDEALVDQDLGLTLPMTDSGIMPQGRFSGKHQKAMQMALPGDGAPMGSRDELDTHLDTFDIELDGLKSLLSFDSINSFDASSLLSLFDLDEPVHHPIPMPSSSRSQETQRQGSQVVTYNPTFDLGYDDHNFFGSGPVEEDSEFLLDEDYICDVKPTPSQLSSTLNTPVDMPTNPPDFRKKKNK